MDLNDYIVANEIQEKGFIRIGKIIDDVFGGTLSLGLANDSLSVGSTYKYLGGVTDSAPADNNMTINMTTMAYSTLK